MERTQKLNHSFAGSRTTIFVLARLPVVVKDLVLDV